MKQLAKDDLSGCQVAPPALRGPRRHVGVATMDAATLNAIARDIVAMDEAANADELDEEEVAAAKAAADRVLSWAKTQLKSTTAETAVAATAAGPEDVLSADAWPEPKALHRAGPEEWDQWAFRRRAGAAHKNQCGSGNAQGSQDALEQMRNLLMVCCSPGCEALVDWKAARRSAKQAKRQHFEDGDGCGGPDCSASHRAKRFADRQREYAAGLESGGKLLMRWPLDRADLAVHAYTAKAARSAAASARMALE